MLKILAKLKPYWWQMILVMALTLAGVYTDLFLPDIMSRIINVGIPTGDRGFVLTEGLKMLGYAVLGILCAVVAGYFSSRVSMSYGRDLRGQVFRRVQSYSLSEYDRFGPASLITRTTGDINLLQNSVMMGLRLLVRAPLMIVGGVTMAYGKSPALFRVIFFSVPVLLAIIISVSVFAMPLSTTIQLKLDRVNRVMREKLTGIRVQRAFGTELYEEQRFDDANADLTRTSIRMNRIMAFMMPAMTLLMTFTQVFIVYNGAWQVDAGAILVGDIMAVVQYIMQIIMSLTMFAMIFLMLPRAVASARRIMEVLEVQSAILDPEEAAAAFQGRGRLEFRDVSFSYGGAQEAALKNISFSAGPGETTAIIGSTGSGKTTLLNLIPRFYDCTQGEILIDGVDVRRMDRKTLRDKIGYVPQKAMLFKGSILENIRYGSDNATDEEVRAAARIAQAEDFILAREEGYGAPVSQLAANLSGGQKQRLSIARAIVRKPEIYLFDDSFSALDATTDKKLRGALSQITKDATVIIVAQKVSTIMGADRIVVMDKGACVGIGTHSQLLKDCQVYQEIVYSQHSEEEVAG